MKGRKVHALVDTEGLPLRVIVHSAGPRTETDTVQSALVVADVKALARECAPEAVSTLKTIMLDTKMPPAARIASANILLERGYGRPSQAVNLMVKSWDLDRLTDEQLFDLKRLLTIIELPGPGERQD